MTSFFDEIDGAAQAAVAGIFGDVVKIKPFRKGGNYGGAIDPDRPVVEFIGTLSTAPKTGTIDYQTTDRNGPVTSVAPAELWVDRANVALIGYLPQKDDKIEVAGTDGSFSNYTVAAVDHQDHGDLRILLMK